MEPSEINDIVHTLKRGDVVRINGSQPCVVTDVTFSSPALSRGGQILRIVLASTNGLPRGCIYTTLAPEAPGIWARELGRPDRDEKIRKVEKTGPNTLTPAPGRAGGTPKKTLRRKPTP